MTRFKGKGLLEPFSCEITLTEPVSVNDLDVLLGLPKEYSSNLIVVRESRKLNMSELIYDGEEITLFLAVMGG